jgi:hypothetical protein
MCSGMVGTLYSSSRICRVTLVTHPLISHECENGWIVSTKKTEHICDQTEERI